MTMGQPYLCETPEHGDADFTVSTIASGDMKFYCVGCFVQFATAVADSILAAMGPEETPTEDAAAHPGAQGGGRKASPRPRGARHVAIHREEDRPAVEPEEEDQATTG